MENENNKPVIIPPKAKLIAASVGAIVTSLSSMFVCIYK